ncbi:MAG TPA: hypothetical protein VM164_04515 [Burkholderiales bacterium]|nr:hypothetical protein [Burkholderiales bacterium]
MADSIADNSAVDNSVSKPSQNLVTLTHVMYGLHAFSALMGMLGTAFIVTAFLTGWPSIIAVVINYVKRSDVRGSYLDSHFGWQLRTFWYAVLWAIVAILLMMTIIGIPFAIGVVLVVGIWVLYRIGRGWLALGEGKAMPVAK